MRSLSRPIALLACVLPLGCRVPIRDWRDLARRSGCTPELLAAAPRFQPAQVGELSGRYTLIQVDTAAGWIEFKRELGAAGKRDLLTLWVPDSLHRWSRGFPRTSRRAPVDIPIMGQLAGYEGAGFSADRPQVRITGPSYDTMEVTFTPYSVMDGELWLLPIERTGEWGFGGYFVEHALVVPLGRNGEGLGSRAGYYCAFRR